MLVVKVHHKLPADASYVSIILEMFIFMAQITLNRVVLTKHNI